jgi:hypothetical protein
MAPPARSRHGRARMIVPRREPPIHRSATGDNSRAHVACRPSDTTKWESAHPPSPEPGSRRPGNTVPAGTGTALIPAGAAPPTGESDAAALRALLVSAAKIDRRWSSVPNAAPPLARRRAVPIRCSSHPVPRSRCRARARARVGLPGGPDRPPARQRADGELPPLHGPRRAASETYCDRDSRLTTAHPLPLGRRAIDTAPVRP